MRASSAACTRSSPSQTNRPSRSRWRRAARRRTSLSRGLAAEVITGSPEPFQPLPVEARVREEALLAVRPEPQPQAPEAVLAGRRLADRNERERELPARVVQGGEELLPALAAQVPPDGCLEHDRQGPGHAFREQLGEPLDDVAALERRRLRAQRLDRPVEPLEPITLVGPDERLQQQGVAQSGDVERGEIDSSPLANPRPEREQPRRHSAPLLAGEDERGVVATPAPMPVAVAVAIPDEVEPRARPELDQVEDLDARPPRELQEAREQQPAALDLVRLDALGSDEAAEPVAALLEHRHRIAPGVEPFAEREVVEAAEELQRAVPAVVVEDLADHGLLREPPAEVGVQRRAAALALLRLVEEDSFELGAQLPSAAFACSAILPKAAGSFTASSASTLRSSSMPALRQPATNWLYESPSARAAALIRMIQSRRKFRFLAFRSRYA